MNRKYGFWAMFGLCFAAAAVTLALVTALFMNYVGGREGLAFLSKINAVRSIVDELYVGEMDWDAAADKASESIVEATGDRWSYYMTGEEYASYTDRSQNSTKGIGVSVTLDEQGRGAYVVSVVAGSPAERAGIKAGCVLTVVNGKSLAGFEISEISALIKSQSGEYEILYLTSEGVTETALITNEVVYTSPVSYRMEENDIGYIRIENFEKGACDDTVAALESLREQGAASLIFDVRANPGGQLYELTELLDYLLPEGEIFVSVSAEGEEEIYYSDENCVSMPMAVLIDENSYSAAEFFAAALQEYEAAAVIGMPSTGKARSQQTFRLSDGSAVHISTRNYLTPNRVSLAEQGGLLPDVQVELTGAEDSQLQKALEYLS